MTQRKTPKVHKPSYRRLPPIYKHLWHDNRSSLPVRHAYAMWRVRMFLSHCAPVRGDLVYKRAYHMYAYRVRPR